MINIHKLILPVFLAALFLCCYKNPAQNTGANAMKTQDSLLNGVSVAPANNDTILFQETHLQDTAFIKGNFVLFLCPDSARFGSYAKTDNNMYTVDGDFGFSISATMDSIAQLKRYRNIQASYSVKRYIIITDCKNGPITIDRDTIDYGLILTAKGKEIKIMQNNIHGGDYLDEVNTYFNENKLIRRQPPQ